MPSSAPKLLSIVTFYEPAGMISNGCVLGCNGAVRRFEEKHNRSSGVAPVYTIVATQHFRPRPPWRGCRNCHVNKWRRRLCLRRTSVCQMVSSRTVNDERRSWQMWAISYHVDERGGAMRQHLYLGAPALTDWPCTPNSPISGDSHASIPT